MTRSETSPGKIIFVPFIDGFGGVERLVLSLSRYLHQRRINHTVLCYRDSLGLERFADTPLRVTRIECPRHALAEAWALRRWLHRLDLDPGRDRFLAFDLKGAFYAASTSRPYVVHLTDPPSLLPADESKRAPSVVGAFPLRALGRPRHLLRSARSQAVHWVNRSGVRKAERVVAMTDSIAAELHQLYGVDPLIVRPGVAAATSDARPKSDGTIRILSVSRLEESKRVAWVLEALSSLERSIPPLRASFDWRFDIVGDGPMRQSLVRLAETLGISDRVHFHGRVSDNELEDFYSAARLFVMPAVQGYGLPALEALSRKVPVIMHRASGVSEILSGTPWVELVDSDRGEDFAGAITRMLNRITGNALSRHPLPPIPTDTEWTRRIADVCGWT